LKILSLKKKPKRRLKTKVRRRKRRRRRIDGINKEMKMMKKMRKVKDPMRKTLMLKLNMYRRKSSMIRRTPFTVSLPKFVRHLKSLTRRQPEKN